MEMDILAILMVAFGLFSILLFILFYIYARNARNKKRENDDYIQEELSDEDLEKFKNIDKDYDNLVDEDVVMKDIENLNIQTDNVDDYKEDGSLINQGIVVQPLEENENEHETKNEHENNIEQENNMEEFVPKKKKNRN